MKLTRSEPTIREILDDPTIQAVMKRDGVKRDELEHLLRIAQLSRRWTGQVKVPKALIEHRVT